MSEKEFERRIKIESKAAIRVTNKNLVCKDCLFRYNDDTKLGNTSKCAVYKAKPNLILLGGKCEFYKHDVTSYTADRGV